METGALMAADPALEAAVTRRGRRAPRGSRPRRCSRRPTNTRALSRRCPTPVLAARADDVRSLGRRAARIAAGAAGPGSRTGRRSSSWPRTSARPTWRSTASERPASRSSGGARDRTRRDRRALAGHPDDGAGGRRAAGGRPTARPSSWTAREGEVVLDAVRRAPGARELGLTRARACAREGPGGQRAARGHGRRARGPRARERGHDGRDRRRASRRAPRERA